MIRGGFETTSDTDETTSDTDDEQVTNRSQSGHNQVRTDKTRILGKLINTDFRKTDKPLLSGIDHYCPALIDTTVRH